ncbi:MAG: TRAP transporter large permease subunit [Pseudomonadota bacterium]
MELAAGILLVVALFGFLGSGLWVALSLFAAAAVAFLIFTDRALFGDFGTIGQILASTVWGASNSWALAALPMFIWMGEILFRSRLSSDLFTGLAPWLSRLPGSLLHVNILGCGIFAAVSGSSAATCATVGKMSMPELKARGYDDRMVIGTLAGSGTLGLLIPPSIILIVYGVAIEESIARLFLAGIGPGAMMLLLFMGYTAAWAVTHRSRMPAQEEARLSLGERLNASRALIPVVALIAGVIGSIYAGIASPTDAAAVGVALSFVLLWVNGELTRAAFAESLMAATRTSCMIALILAGAAFLTVAMGFTGIPRALATWIGDLGLGQVELLVALTLFFIVLGCFLDGISVVVLTTAVIVPMVEAVGIDRIWFGIFLVLVVEMSQITPPVGFNLFVLQGMTGRNVLEIAGHAAPFFLMLILGVALITLFPGIALWLPDQMTR